MGKGECRCGNCGAEKCNCICTKQQQQQNKWPLKSSIRVFGKGLQYLLGMRGTTGRGCCQHKQIHSRGHTSLSCSLAAAMEQGEASKRGKHWVRYTNHKQG